MKELVVFGCSWAYGSELADPNLDYTDKDGYNGDGSDFDYSNDQYRLQYCFGNLLAIKLGRTLNLKAEPGNSNYGIFCNFHQWLDSCPNKNALVIFAMTDSNRHSWLYKDQLHHSSWIQWDRKHPLFDVHKQWLVNINSDQWQINNENLITKSIIDSCENRGINFVMFNSLPRKGSIDHNNYLWRQHTMQQELTNFDSTCFASGGHPNERGHIRIAELLHNFIDNKQIIK